MDRGRREGGREERRKDTITKQFCKKIKPNILSDFLQKKT
jgi:hypothetical protein